MSLAVNVLMAHQHIIGYSVLRKGWMVTE